MNTNRQHFVIDDISLIFIVEEMLHRMKEEEWNDDQIYGFLAREFDEHKCTEKTGGNVFLPNTVEKDNQNT